MKTEHHTLTKTWVVAALASLCCILWGSAIPMIKTGSPGTEEPSGGKE